MSTNTCNLSAKFIDTLCGAVKMARLFKSLVYMTVPTGLAYALYVTSENMKKNDKPPPSFVVSPTNSTAPQYDMNKAMTEVLMGGGPTDLAELRKQTDARRKRVAEDYAKANYEFALRRQKEDEEKRLKAEEEEKLNK
jgi:hypothetical protein